MPIETCNSTANVVGSVTDEVRLQLLATAGRLKATSHQCLTTAGTIQRLLESFESQGD